MTALALLVCLTAGVPAALAPAQPEHRPCVPGHCALSGPGWGTSYRPGAMEATVRVNIGRGLLAYRDLPAAALPNCDTLSRVFWARVQTAAGAWSRWTTFQQADCSQYRDWATHTRNGTRAWLEVGYKSAVRLGLIGVGRFRVQIALGGTP